MCYYCQWLNSPQETNDTYIYTVYFNFNLRYKKWCYFTKKNDISDYVGGIFQIELQTKDTTDPVQYISYLSLNLEIGNEDWVKLKRLKFSFRIYRKITDVITGWMPVIISVSQMTTNIFQ